MSWRRLMMIAAAAALAAAPLGCSDDGANDPDENRSPILDGFDSGNQPSPCQGVTVSAGAACSLPDGAFCATTVTCACYPTTRTLACECTGGTWSCPEGCANEQPPCPEADTSEPDLVDLDDDADADDTSTDTSTDTTGDDTSADTATDTVEPPDTMPDVVEPTATITAVNQTLDDLSTRVVVSEVVADGAGFVVVSSAGQVLGHAAVAAGTTSGVEVELDAPLADGDPVVARLHGDAGQTGVFEPALDLVVMDGGGPVEASFTVTVPSGTPAVRLSVATPGDAAWDFAPAEPSTIDAVGAAAENQALTLRTGWRYEVVNASAALALDLTASDGTVLLSQGGGGTLEADAAVAWSSSGGVLRFTLAPSLASALAGYQAASDPTIGGAVVVE